jgi:hypothetical protein
MRLFDYSGAVATIAAANLKINREAHNSLVTTGQKQIGFLG